MRQMCAQDNPEKPCCENAAVTCSKQGISWGKEWQVMGSENFSS